MKHPRQTKKGAASIYVVIFTALLLGIITIAFMRLVIREASKTTDDELAQSAYDSALAGAEDAKTVLRLYKENKLPAGIEAKSLFGSEDCDLVAKTLGNTPDATGTMIKEKDTVSDEIVQYYTCVKINNKLSEYRSYLDSSSAAKIVPLRSDGHAGEVRKLMISWFSSDDGDFDKLSFSGTPPILSAQIIQTDKTYELEEFDIASDVGTNRGTVFLYPSKNSGGTTVSSEMIRLSNSHTQPNYAGAVRCLVEGVGSDDFACTVIIEVPKTYRGSYDRLEDNFFLVLSLPYRHPKTSFAVSMLKENGEIIKFSDVQFAIDSTGRANDMYSRVETRVEFFDDITFPEYPVQATGNDKGAIEKGFYATSDCWTVKKGKDEKWGVESCNNSGNNN